MRSRARKPTAAIPASTSPRISPSFLARPRRGGAIAAGGGRGRGRPLATAGGAGGWRQVWPQPAQRTTRPRGSSTGGRGRVPLMMHGNRPMTVRQRLARLRELARAEYLHRRH